MKLVAIAIASLIFGFAATAEAQVVVIVDINAAPPLPPLTPPTVGNESASIPLSPTSSLPPANAPRTMVDSLTEGCFEPDSLTEQVTDSLQRVDSLGQKAASDGNNQDLIALTSEFNRLEGLLNSLIQVYGDTIVDTPTPACENLAESITTLIEEIRAYQDVLEQQLFSLLW